MGIVQARDDFEKGEVGIVQARGDFDFRFPREKGAWILFGATDQLLIIFQGVIPILFSRIL